jgi:hypothetical protein
MPVEVIDDIARLGNHDSVVNQHWHERFGIDRDELWRQMLVVSTPAKDLPSSTDTGRGPFKDEQPDE